jgi:hypothetical protein
VELKPGQVEVYPAGAKAIRAPLGRGCYLLDSNTYDPVSGDRAAQLYTLDQLLRNESYDVLAVPADYPATAMPTQSTGVRRRAVGQSAFMLEVDRLLSDGLWRASQRNDALLKLNWLFQAVWRFDEQRAADELWCWLQAHHNGRSREYSADPAAVQRKIGDIARCFDASKVADLRPLAAPGRALAGIDGAIQAYVDVLPLDTRERELLANILRVAHRRGEPTFGNAELDVEIPARTLKAFDRKYGAILPALIEPGFVVKSRNYGRDIGRANTYRVACLDGPSKA